MAITRPSADQVRELAASLHMSLSPEEAAAYRALMDASFDAYDVVDALPDHIPPVKYPRTPGTRPSPEENPLGAWYWKSEVKGADTGKLAGKTVALKDNVALAGVPMMNGASTLEGFVPATDATIVTRMLDAGATILGKAVCEHFCLSGGSHTSDPGPVHNPHRMGYSAGGSSSGSGALVAAGEVDMAIGGDQGGSIRIPAAYCGIYGMKPTHGLVPYTGVMPIETTIDHTGPMTASVADNALLLEVLAGPDGLDPRQYAPQVAAYTEALKKGARGLKIGLLLEGFSAPGMQEAVADKVRAAAARFEALGATVEEVSLPAYRTAASVWTPIGLEGLTQQMMLGNGMGFNWKGAYDVGLFDAHSAWRAKADDLSETLKISMLIGQWGLTHYRGRYYAKAQNLARKVREDFSECFKTYDLLLCPTLPCTATKLPEKGAPLEEIIVRAFEMVASTSPMDVTGNPSMSIPCGLVDGLPVGLMLTARDWNESAIYQAAHAFEAAGDWKTF
ncbi:amidase [Methylobacterium sp. 174MFSha1.1]|uniref:amidase n=1 Tax=Methylobacterium sp. 174MFSha1.1 TaxID=1502749 RepID=UPI0008E324C1|nr:amidase [Methylobacterium sp. 174MFSha1.1]SFU55896.1 amidase [Methylobacterium sp. 174MFSha1.1]